MIDMVTQHLRMLTTKSLHGEVVGYNLVLSASLQADKGHSGWLTYNGGALEQAYSLCYGCFFGFVKGGNMTVGIELLEPQ